MMSVQDSFCISLETLYDSSGHLVFKENYEIHGDIVFPNAHGPAVSRKGKAKLFDHINIQLVGKVDNFPRGNVWHHIEVF